MPLPTTIEIKTKVGKENIDSKSEFEVDALAMAKEETVCANQERRIDLYGGPKKDIDFLHINADKFNRDEANGCPGPGQQTAWIKYKFVGAEGNGDASDDFAILDRAQYFAGNCAKAKLPERVEAIIIKNELATDVKISVLLARSKQVEKEASELIDMPVRAK